MYSRTLPGGDFSHPFAASVLLNANGSSCARAAFAESLYVSAKATNGWGSRLSHLDASALRAFALSD